MVHPDRREYDHQACQRAGCQIYSHTISIAEISHLILCFYSLMIEIPVGILYELKYILRFNMGTLSH